MLLISSVSAVLREGADEVPNYSSQRLSISSGESLFLVSPVQVMVARVWINSSRRLLGLCCCLILKKRNWGTDDTPAELICWSICQPEIQAWQCVPWSGCRFHSLLLLRKRLVIFWLHGQAAVFTLPPLPCPVSSLHCLFTCSGPLVPKACGFLFWFVAALVFVVYFARVPWMGM